MALIDWILVGGSLLIVLAIGLYTQRFMNSVADFMSAGRVAGRYLLAVARGEMSAGAVVFVATFEMVSQSGFANWWWGWLTAPIGLIVGISGFVIYRYRETRAMTLGQFFEIRYSKAFRLFTGFLGFGAGLVNFGIIPAVGARFMVYFLGMPQEVQLFSWTVPTFVLLMTGFLLINVIVTLMGGLITIMMTNCVEGIISQILYLVLIFGLLSMFSWSDISEVLSSRPAGQSFLNPMDSMGLKDFNIWWIIMGTVISIYGTMAWQNQSSYHSAPLNAHEGRMGGLLGRWRGMGTGTVVILLAVCAMTYLKHPEFSEGAARVQQQVAQISNPQIQRQMEIPIAVVDMLPIGLRGALCAVLLLGIFGGDSTHLHSWGSLFVQDVILPFRKKAFTPKQHILILRLSIVGVALFALIFGSLFKQTEYIMMWWSVTGSLYIGGAGAAIIGGLYWKKATTAGAWVGLITGSTLSVGGIIARQIYGNGFFLNGTEIAFYAMLIAVTAFVVVSLLTCREDFNMDRMLHRGKYAAVAEKVGDEVPAARPNKISWGKIIGYDDHFTRGDKWIAGGLFFYSMLWVVVMAVGTVAYVAYSKYYGHPWPVSVWSTFWHIVAIVIPIFFAVVTGIWFTWGGIVDSISLFKRLELARTNPLDNGAVVNHQNLDEAVATPSPSPVEKRSIATKL